MDGSGESQQVTRSWRTGKIATWCVTATAFLLALIGLVRVLPALCGQGDAPFDFANYYRAASALNEGRPLYGAGYLYPPFFAAILRPRAALPLPMAANVWNAVNILMACLIPVFVARIAVPGMARLRHYACAFALTWLIPATYESILLGQVNLLIAASLCGTVMLTQSRRTQSD